MFWCDHLEDVSHTMFSLLWPTVSSLSSFLYHISLSLSPLNLHSSFLYQRVRKCVCVWERKQRVFIWVYDRKFHVADVNSLFIYQYICTITTHCFNFDQRNTYIILNYGLHLSVVFKSTCKATGRTANVLSVRPRESRMTRQVNSQVKQLVCDRGQTFTLTPPPPLETYLLHSQTVSQVIECSPYTTIQPILAH